MRTHSSYQSSTGTDVKPSSSSAKPTLQVEPALPLELIIRIFELVLDLDWARRPSNLCSYSILSSSFRLWAQQKLWEEVYIQTRLARRSFVSRLDEQPELATHVKKLGLYAQSSQEDLSWLPFVGPQVSEEVGVTRDAGMMKWDVLGLTTNLTVLSLHRTPRIPFRLLLQCKGLRALYLHRTIVFDCDEEGSFEHLECLSLISVLIRTRSRNRFRESSTFPSLRTLTAVEVTQRIKNGPFQPFSSISPPLLADILPSITNLSLNLRVDPDLKSTPPSMMPRLDTLSLLSLDEGQLGTLGIVGSLSVIRLEVQLTWAAAINTDPINDWIPEDPQRLNELAASIADELDAGAPSVATLKKVELPRFHGNTWPGDLYRLKNVCLAKGVEWIEDNVPENPFRRATFWKG
ncbi:hypothetical protein T439DRAFT_329612 [Meredithblackwellia eburnea MCA 4105]